MAAQSKVDVPPFRTASLALSKPFVVVTSSSMVNRTTLDPVGHLLPINESLFVQNSTIVGSTTLDLAFAQNA